MNDYLVALLVVLLTVSATTLLLNYDDSVKGGVLYQLAHYMSYIYSGLGHR